MSRAFEINFDGLVGPTHNYAGLSYGNVASMSNRRSASNPKQAALQGLAKMKFCFDLGLKQAVLPPHERPHMPTLRRLGYGGSDADVLAKVQKDDPQLLSAASSASAMWAANAATVSPSADTFDKKVHITPANLISNLHRSLEPPTTSRVLRAIFADQHHFVHHDPLPATVRYSDEGAANHTRLGAGLNHPGVEIFTVGWFESEDIARPEKFPARQSFHASNAIARMHLLHRDLLRFVHQNPQAIDAGAFHNDVVAVGHRNVLLYHERAWVQPDDCLKHLETFITEFRPVEVSEAELPLAEAIQTYFFNSQLVSVPGGGIVMVAPLESHENERAHGLIQRFVADGTISAAHFVDLRQSMRNGGGPACLRLRVVLTDQELAATHAGVMFSEALHEQLRAWIERHYRDHLAAEDLADAKLMDESRRALDELTQILSLGSIYEFQRDVERPLAR